jgi:hypothetical protein
MSSFLADITNRDVIAAASHTARFAEARARMIAENVANLHTPDYRTRTLDVRGFQRALREALTERGGDSGRRLVVRSGGEVTTDTSGRLAVTPAELPVHNLLMHDGLERYYYAMPYGPYYIWGATAGMLMNLYAHLMRTA